MDISSLNLPASVVAAVELTPVEDFMLTLLRDLHPDLLFYSWIPFDMTSGWLATEPFVLVRREPSMSQMSFDERFIDLANVSIQVFVRDPEADLKGALISEAIRSSLHKEVRWPTYYPGLGSLSSVHRAEEAIRKTDWASGTGPVQFADLPTGFVRYEAVYRVQIRRPLWG